MRVYLHLHPVPVPTPRISQSTAVQVRAFFPWIESVRQRLEIQHLTYMNTTTVHLKTIHMWVHGRTQATGTEEHVTYLTAIPPRTMLAVCRTTLVLSYSHRDVTLR